MLSMCIEINVYLTKMSFDFNPESRKYLSTLFLIKKVTRNAIIKVYLSLISDNVNFIITFRAYTNEYRSNFPFYINNFTTGAHGLLS